MAALLRGLETRTRRQSYLARGGAQNSPLGSRDKRKNLKQKSAPELVKSKSGSHPSMTDRVARLHPKEGPEREKKEALYF